MCKIFLISIVFMQFYSAGVLAATAARPDGHKTKCEKFLLNSYEESYLALIEVLVKNKLIAESDLAKVISDLNNKIYGNPLAHKNLRSEALPYKHAFDRIILDLNSLSEDFIDRLVNILTNSKSLARAENIIREERAEVFSPRLGASAELDSLNSSELIQLTTKAGKEMLVVATSNLDLYLIDLNDLLKPIYLGLSIVPETQPAHFVSKDGKDMILVSSNSGGLYLVDIENPQINRRIQYQEQIDGHPLYFKSKDGRDMVAIASRNHGNLCLLDLNNEDYFREFKNIQLVWGKPSYFMANDGREFIVTASFNAVTIIDFNSRSIIKNIKIETGANSPIFSQIYFKSQDGRDMLVLSRGAGRLLLIDLNNSKVNDISTLSDFSSSLPIHFVSQDGRDIIAFGSVDNNSAMLNLLDINNIKIPIQIVSGGLIDSRPTHFISRDKRDIIAYHSKDNHLNFISLEDPGSRMFIKIKKSIKSHVTSFITKTEGAKMAIGLDKEIFLVNLYDAPIQEEVSR